MGFISGIFKRLIRLIFYLAVIVAFILLIPNLPPYTKFTRIELEPTLPRVGALAPNDVLNNAKPLYKGKLLGPEAFRIWNGEVYTGLATGEIVKVSPGGHVTFVAQLGQPCTGLVQEHICGRPLGFEIDEKKKLMYVADAYHGIWAVNLVTNKKQLLVSPRLAIDGKVPKFFNALVLDRNGDFYWTDSSSDFHLRDGLMTLLSDPAGRLLHYNTAKNISKVLLDNLWFPNGVVVSPDNQYVIVAETNRYRLIKYYVNGPKKGTSEVFVSGLPGTPDNVRPLPDGSGILVGLYTVFDDDYPLLSKTLASTPLARKFIVRLLRLIEIPFEFLHSQFPNHIFETIIHQIGTFGPLASMIPETSGLVQIDWNGNIIASYYNTDKSLVHISDAIVFNDNLYMGCPHVQNFIASVPAPPQLIKAFTAKKESVKEQPTVKSKSSEQNQPKVEEKKDVPKNAKPVTQLPKQTTAQPTTTEKPTTPQPTTTQKPTTKSNDIPKQTTPPAATQKPTSSQPTTTQKPTTKPNDIPKEKAVKQNNVPKVSPNQGDDKPKTGPKDAGAKPKLEIKESDTKPKVAPQAETKPKVAQKDAEPKVKVAPQNNAEPKPSATVKNQEPQTKPETESKLKVNDKKPEQKLNKNQPDVKPKVPVSKPETQNAKMKSTESKPANADNESAKKASKQAPAREPVPVKEHIPSDTVKPNKETLKVIKKSGPQEIPNPNL